MGSFNSRLLGKRVLSLALAFLLSSGVFVLACARESQERAGDVIRVGLWGQAVSLDPHLQDDTVSRSILLNSHEALVSISANMTLRPALAERWESPSDYSWRFTLREGVQFHDGRFLTAEDVVFSLKRAQEHPESRASGHLVAVATISQVNALTVELTTHEPYPLLLNKLASVAIIPANSPDSQQPSGTGPYKLTLEDAGVRLERFSEYWGPSPEVESFLIVAEPDPGARLDRLLKGEFDIAHSLPPREVSRAKNLPGVKVVSRSSFAVAFLALRVDKPPFDDWRVRQAVHLALDRNSLLRQSRGGSGNVASQLVGPNVFGFDPGIAPPLFNLEQSRHLLREAGYSEGLEVPLVHREGVSIQHIVEMLGKVGIRVIGQPFPWEDLLVQMKKVETVFSISGFTCISGEASDFFDYMVHSAEPTNGYGENNIVGLNSPELDAAIEEARGVLDPRLRKMSLQRAMRLLMEELAYLPLWVPDHVDAVREGIQWQPHAGGDFVAAEVKLDL